jgi:hypothetical protein
MENIASIFRLKNELIKQQSLQCYLFLAGCMRGLFFDPQDGDSVFTWSNGNLQADYNSYCPTRDVHLTGAIYTNSCTMTL